MIASFVASGDIAGVIILVMIVEIVVLFRRRPSRAWRAMPNIVAGMGLLAAWLVSQTNPLLALLLLAGAGIAHAVSLIRS